MKSTIYLYLFVISLVLSSCGEVTFTLSSHADDFFFLKNKNATMPVAVKGNTASKTFVILLNGGPGGSSLIYDNLFGVVTEPLEEDNAMVYWEQRSSGAAQGTFDNSLMTPKQYVEDLEHLIQLLQFHYGNDIQFFLMGLSWGGYLGYSYLSKIENQSVISGFINVAGPHNLQDMATWSKKRLIQTATHQLNTSTNNTSEWQEILDWCSEKDTILNKTDFRQVNDLAMKAEILQQDSLLIEMETASFGTQWGFIFTSPFSATQEVSNQRIIIESQLLDRALEEKLDSLLPNILVPVITFGGKFDYLVPHELLTTQHELLGSPNKTLMIFEKSGHSIISHQTTSFLASTKAFINLYR